MIDLVFIVILLAACLIGARKGIIGAAAGLFGTLLAYLGAAKIAVPLLTPGLAKALLPQCEKVLLGSVGDSVRQAVQTPFAQATQSLDGLLEALHVPGHLFDAVGQKLVESGDSVLRAAAEVISRQVAPILAFLAGFLLCKLVLWALVHVIGGGLPVVRTINRGAGLLLGAVGGAAIVVALCLGVRAFAPQGFGGAFSQQAVEESMIGGAVYRLLPPSAPAAGS